MAGSLLVLLVLVLLLEKGIVILVGLSSTSAWVLCCALLDYQKSAFGIDPSTRGHSAGQAQAFLVSDVPAQVRTSPAVRYLPSCQSSSVMASTCSLVVEVPAGVGPCLCAERERENRVSSSPS